MNIAKLSVLPWLGLYEAAHYLTSKLNCGPYGSENGISETDVLQFALAGHFLLTLDIPPGMKDKQGQELEHGSWDLVMTRERGKPGRRQVKHRLDPSVSVKDIDGAWVARKVAGKRVVRQLQPQRSYGGESSSAFPEGVALGVRTKALNDFAKKQGQTPSKAADALRKPLRPNEKEKLLTIIYALTKNPPQHPIDLSNPTEAAKSIEMLADMAGLTVSAKTIQRRLEEMVMSIRPRDENTD